eukprot:gb/GECG01006448.1/.p1 GENE.gb/GECG01006448.1/~~gb/GECG01006448.1/.p1  ORF type:complete len:1242 (+),score=141.05 gb/GECG01006448.1/:1-3726(+)
MNASARPKSPFSASSGASSTASTPPLGGSTNASSSGTKSTLQKQAGENGPLGSDIFETARAWSFVNASRDRSRVIFPDPAAPTPAGGIALVQEDGSEIMVFRETGDIDCKIPQRHANIQRVAQSPARPNVLYALEDTHLVAHINWHRIVEDELVDRDDYYGLADEYGTLENSTVASLETGESSHTYRAVSLPLPAYQLYNRCPLAVCPATGIIGIVIMYPRSAPRASVGDAKGGSGTSIEPTDWRLPCDEDEPHSMALKMFTWTMSEEFQWRPIYSITLQEFPLGVGVAGSSPGVTNVSQQIQQIAICGSLVAISRGDSTDVVSVLNAADLSASEDVPPTPRAGQKQQEWNGFYAERNMDLALFPPCKEFFICDTEMCDKSAVLLLRRLESSAEELLSIEFLTRGIAPRTGRYRTLLFVHTRSVSLEYEIFGHSSMVFNPLASANQWVSQTSCDFAQEIAESSLRAVEEMFCLEDVLERSGNTGGTNLARYRNRTAVAKQGRFPWRSGACSAVATRRGVIGITPEGTLEGYSWNSMSPDIRNRDAPYIEEATASKMAAVRLDLSAIERPSSLMHFTQIFSLPDAVVVWIRSSPSQGKRNVLEKAPRSAPKTVSRSSLLPFMSIKNPSQIHARADLAIHVEMYPVVESAASLVNQLKDSSSPKDIELAVWNCFTLLQNLLVQSTHRFDFYFGDEPAIQFEMHVKQITSLLKRLVIVSIDKISKCTFDGKELSPLIRGVTHCVALLLVLPFTESKDIIEVAKDLTGRLRAWVSENWGSPSEMLFATILLCALYAQCSKSSLTSRVSSSHEVDIPVNGCVQTAEDDAIKCMKEISVQTANMTFRHLDCWRIGEMIELMCGRYSDQSSTTEICNRLEYCVPQAMLKDSHLPINAQRCLAIFDVILLCSQRNRVVSAEIARVFFGSSLLNVYESIIGIESIHSIDLLLCLIMSRKACEELVLSTEVKEARFGDHITGDIPPADGDTLYVALLHLRDKPLDVNVVLLKGCILDTIYHQNGHNKTKNVPHLLISEFVDNVSRPFGNVRYLQDHRVNACWKQLPKPWSLETLKKEFCPKESSNEHIVRMVDDLFTLCWNIPSKFLPTVLKEVNEIVVKKRLMDSTTSFVDKFRDYCLLLAGIRMNRLEKSMRYLRLPSSRIAAVEATKSLWKDNAKNDGVETTLWRIILNGIYENYITSTQLPLGDRQNALSHLKDVVESIDTKLGRQASIFALPSGISLSSGWCYACP